jgi:putative ABC transport system permease protein
MLNQFFHDPLSLGIAQALVATVMALAVMLIAHFARIHLEREILIALARAFVQVLAVGSVLLLIFEGPVVVGFLVLGLMMLLAAQTASRRAQGMPQSFRVSLIGIILGAGPVIILMAWMGVIDTKLTVLIPVGSMIVANSMTTTSLALDRFRGEISSHVGHIDAALALGASPKAAVAPYTRAAVRASLIPRIDSLSSLGIVWIPGVMTGMLLAGSQPIDAALYQFVVMAMIFTVSGLENEIILFSVGALYYCDCHYLNYYLVVLAA